MILGNMAGNWLGGLGSDESSAPGTPAPSAISSPRMNAASSPSSGGTSAVVNHMARQTILLENIAGSMTTGNSIQREIRDRIGFSSASGDTKPRDSTRKSSNIALIPATLGSG